ncbi:unnamed protein product [Protopolystoma xenopodis]|uniref:RRM domain-containing protein n=1 Tax=Protopolystoma xenopodis TaxID=117903 RepID=A0A3S5CDZ5_9PLAT|nr:unnamed protein product [Protopolystoma xenopodis]
MARITDDAGEKSGNVPRPRSYSENDAAYNGLRTSYRSSGEFRGLAFLEFETSSAAHAALTAYRISSEAPSIKSGLEYESHSQTNRFHRQHMKYKQHTKQPIDSPHQVLITEHRSEATTSQTNICAN